jgi:2-keto-4-pentenoate hydratase
MESPVDLLDAAARGGARVRALPTAMSSVAEALALQDQLVARSGKAVAGYKVSTDPAGMVMYGAIYADDCHDSPATVSASRFPLLGIEGEVAYRFTADLPSRVQAYERAYLEPLLVPFPAIEIVDSRFESYQATPVLDRLVDRMSNGGMVLGAATGPRKTFEDVHVTLTIDGTTKVHQDGGHSRGDPFLPALEFIRAQQQVRAFTAGQFITTGTFTGLIFAHAGQRIEVAFSGLGVVRMTTAR